MSGRRGPGRGRFIIRDTPHFAATILILRLCLLLMAAGIYNTNALYTKLVYLYRYYDITAPAAGGVLNTNDAASVVEEILPAQNKSYQLGLKLKLQQHEVDAINSTFREPSDRLLHIIIKFLEGTEPRPTWRVIIDALRSPLVDLPALASKLEAVHFPDSTSTGGVPTETTGRSFCLVCLTPK